MRSFRKTVTISGTGVGKVAGQVLDSLISGTVTGVKVRAATGGVTAKVYLTQYELAATPPDEDVLYESSSTAFTTSTTAADISDSFGSDPQPFSNGLWAMVDETVGAGAWVLEILVYGFLEG